MKLCSKCGAEKVQIPSGKWKCERDRDLELLGGLLAEYPREPSPVPRPVTDLSLDPLS